MALPVLDSTQSAELDSYTIKKMGIPAQLLMENAGREIYLAIKDKIKTTESISILCGSGNNGGDGFVIAAYLFENGFDVTVFHIKNLEDISKDASFHALKLRENGFVQFEILKKESLSKIKKSAIIIDALLGTGFNGQLKSNYADILTEINKTQANKIAIDIPSGLNSTTGIGLNAFQADRTITIGFPKRGLYINDGIKKSGNITIVDIGFPKEIDTIVHPKIFLNQLEDIAALLPKRIVDSNKSEYGKIGVIGGSISMTGSVILTSLAALKTGAGLVKTAVPQSIYHNIDGQIPELMVIPINKKNDLDDLINWADVIVIGMGLGQSNFAYELLNHVILTFSQKLIIDADGLNLLSKELRSRLQEKDVLLTPHLGEFSRLIDKNVENIKSTIFDSLSDFSIANKVSCLLKGKTTLIANASGEIHIDISGNSGLSTAGSGDVLSDLIAGFAGQGLLLTESADLSAYLHGKSAEIGTESLTEYSFLASDILNYLPQAIKSII